MGYNPKTFRIAQQEWQESIETTPHQLKEWVRRAELALQARLRREPGHWPISKHDAATYRQINRARYERLLAGLKRGS